MILVLTGEGKGKTTSAIGQGIRAIGQGKRVIMFQFIKSKEWVTGEDKVLAKIENFTLKKGGRGFVGIMGDNLPIEEHQKAAKETLSEIKEASHSGKYDLVIMDEVNVAVNLGLILAKDVLDIINTAPAGVDFILTGRSAPKEFIDQADIVSEIKEIKHHFQKGVWAKKGIEY